MIAGGHRTHIYIGLAGEGEFVDRGRLLRKADGDAEWQDISSGLPRNPPVRALLLRRDNPAMIYAGTQEGVYRSNDRGSHWEALDGGAQGNDVWSLTVHPNNPDVIFAGFEPCSISRSQDGGNTWEKMDTSRVVFPNITTYMEPTAKRVMGIAIDPVNPVNMYAAVEVGGLLASRDGGESWDQLIEGPFLSNNTLDLHQVQVSAAAPDTVHIATQTAMFRSRDRGYHWEHVQVDAMFPGGSYCRDLLVAPNDPETIYLAAGAGGGGAAPADTVHAGALFRSRDTGESWARVDLGDFPPGRMMQIAIDLANPSRVCCAACSGEVYNSADGGQSWDKSVLPVVTSRSLHVYPMICG